MGSVAAGQVPGDSFFGRHRPDIAPARNSQAAAIGGHIQIADLFRSIFEHYPALGFLIVNDHSDLFVFIAAAVKRIEIPPIFKNDGRSVSRREFHIIIIKITHFAYRSGGKVILKDIHRTVAVGEKINGIAHPHRDDILGGVFRDFFHLLAFEVENKNVIGHPAFVVFPCAEFAKDLVESQLFPIGRVTAKTGRSKRQFFGQPAFEPDAEELPFE